MSYILEALRRAESERERKRGVPGLHAQPVPAPTSDDGGERRSKPWRWVALGVAAGVLLPVAWRLGSSEAPADEAPSPRSPVAGNVTAQAPAPAPPPAAVPAPPVEAPTAAAHAGPAPTTAEPPTAPAPKSVSKPPPKHSPMPKTSAPVRAGDAAPVGAAPATDARTAAPARDAAPTAARTDANAARPDATPTGPAPQVAAAPEPRLRTLAELPDELRRAVPQLAFGGSVYSDIAAQRMVIFNGQVLREGDPLSDELMLEQIRPRSAVLRLRGQRFEVPF